MATLHARALEQVLRVQQRQKWKDYTRHRGEKINEGELVTECLRHCPFETERDIFDYMGLTYLEPHERNL